VDGGCTAAVKLRGLPFTAHEQDVLAFFSKHDVVHCIFDGPNPVRIITKAGGKPSGQAIVQMNSTDDAEAALQALHGQWMDQRYIEVFHHVEGAEKGGAPPGVSPIKPSVAPGPGPAEAPVEQILRAPQPVAMLAAQDEPMSGVFAGAGDSCGSGGHGAVGAHLQPVGQQQQPKALHSSWSAKVDDRGNAAAGAIQPACEGQSQVTSNRDGSQGEEHKEHAWEALFQFLNTDQLEGGTGGTTLPLGLGLGPTGAASMRDFAASSPWEAPGANGSSVAAAGAGSACAGDLRMDTM